MIMKVRITDLDTKAVDVYDLSEKNWRKHWAAMRDGLVIMWIPRNTPHPFKMVTSGRRWESFQWSGSWDDEILADEARKEYYKDADTHDEYMGRDNGS